MTRRQPASPSQGCGARQEVTITGNVAGEERNHAMFDMIYVAEKLVDQRREVLRADSAKSRRPRVRLWSR